MDCAPLLPRESPCRRRLWQGVFASLLVLACLWGGNLLLNRDRAVTAPMLGKDFLAFYTAGTFVRRGELQKLYDLQAVRDFQHELGPRHGVEMREGYGPWWNPPFFVHLFVPLAQWSYPQALEMWWLMMALCAVLAAALLARWVWQVDRRPAVWLLAPALLVVSFPFFQAMSHGQNSALSLLLLASAVALWRGNTPLLAGLVAGLLFYKPQVGAAVALVMTLALGWRCLLGLTITGAGLLLLNMLTLPGTLHDFLVVMPANIHVFQVENEYLWNRHATLKAFWRLLFQGREIGPMGLPATAAWLASSAVLAAALAMVAWRSLRRQGTGQCHHDRLIAATVASMPLLMPFYFDYDLVLLAIPLTLHAVDRLTRPAAIAGDGVVLWSAVALACWGPLNAGVGLETGVNLSVIFAAGVAVGLLRVAWKAPSATAAMPQAAESPATLPAAIASACPA